MYIETEYYTIDTIGYEIHGSEISYWEVTTTSGDPIKAWVFEPGILPLYTGTRAGLPDLKRLTDWSNYLNSLDPGAITDREKAWEFVQTHFADSQGALADAVYWLLVRFCNSSTPYLSASESQKFLAFFELQFTPEMNQKIRTGN